jgi:UDP-N-acetylmuramoyl-tripeptide--D-alanyl-D-alanine ligase
MPKNFQFKLNEITGYISDKVFPSLAVKNFSVDSRLVEKDGIFFALKGCRNDGHAFLEEVAQKKAMAAIVRKDYGGPDYGLALIKVTDPLQALQTITRQVISRRKPRVVGITGSVGKTTTKEFTYQLLKQKYRVAASPGNSNSQIGLPLAILNDTEGQEEILVLEMGMTEAGQIKQLIEIAPPEVAVITKTALVHAQNFKDLQAIGLAKAEIFSHPTTKLGILSRDITNFEELCQVGVCQKISFSSNALEADFTLVRKNGYLQINHQNSTMLLASLPVRGDHNVHNFLASVGVARYLNVDWELIKDAIPSLVLPERRLQDVEKKGILFVNDSYNASEASVKAALQSLPKPSPKPSPGGKQIAILGEMLELGPFAEKCHWEVGKYALDYTSHMICFGKECKAIYDLWKSENRPVEWVMTLEEVVMALKSIANPGDVVLLKGSRSKELWRVLDAIE